VIALLLLSGVTGVSDSWHDFDATSAAAADALRAADMDVVVQDSAVAAADEFARADGLVVNCGRRSPPGRDEAATEAFVDLLGSERPVLAIHTSAAAFADLPQWADRVAVRWIDGRSMHPPIGQIALSANDSHPIGAGLGIVDVYDELYTDLDVGRPGETVLSHHHEGVDHPLSLAREDPDGRRTVYDALGHSVESYQSSSRRELLRREMLWLLEGAEPK
jgi:hypothetical protein